MQRFGGNLVTKVDVRPTAQTALCESPYFYKHFSCLSGNLNVDLSGTFCVYILEGALSVNQRVLDVTSQSCVLAGRIDQLQILKNGTRFLIAGVQDEKKSKQKITFLENHVAHVNKPWGYESWICDGRLGFVFKSIFIRSGTKTSLQFHKFKHETNFLYEGEARLHYTPRKTGQDKVDLSKDVSVCELNVNSVIDVAPNCIHRMEAVTDLVFYEVSTAELDDVVRIVDDSNRPSGRIEAEHGNERTVCILAAGRGSRLGDYSQIVNKALLPLNNKAIISHIIEKFDKSDRFVIAVGHMGDQVRDYVQLAHADRNIVFVPVDNYDGPGSGPGESIKSCRTALAEKPFYFVSCDTLWSDDIRKVPIDRNWMAVSEVPDERLPEYSLIFKNGDLIESIKDKYGPRNSAGGLAFTGMGYVRDAAPFWEGILRHSNDSGEKQVMDGFISLLASKPISAVKIDWTDVGNKNDYEAAYAKFASFNFSKSDELFYSVNDKIVKFFSDLEITENRVRKAALVPAVFPAAITRRGNFYSYDFQRGRTFYEAGDEMLFKKLLDWLMQNLWLKREISSITFEQMCRKFYYDKTRARLEKYARRYNVEAKIINGRQIPNTNELIAKIDFTELSKGIPYFIHGDLQPDNVVYDSINETFTLIDWRQDFAGHIEVGDLYYDFAKLLGGLILNYSEIKRNEFKAIEDSDSIKIEFNSVAYLNEGRAELQKRATLMNLDFKRVNLITGLIYLNMSPLHHFPFDKFLNALGRILIFENLPS